MGNRRRASKLQKTVMLYRKPEHVRFHSDSFSPKGNSVRAPSNQEPYPSNKKRWSHDRPWDEA